MRTTDSEGHIVVTLFDTTAPATIAPASDNTARDESRTVVATRAPETPDLTRRPDDKDREYLASLTDDRIKAYRQFLASFDKAAMEEQVRRTFFETTTLPSSAANLPNTDFTPIYRDTVAAIQEIREKAAAPLESDNARIGTLLLPTSDANEGGSGE